MITLRIKINLTLKSVKKKKHPVLKFDIQYIHIQYLNAS